MVLLILYLTANAEGRSSLYSGVTVGTAGSAMLGACGQRGHAQTFRFIAVKIVVFRAVRPLSKAVDCRRRYSRAFDDHLQC